LSACARCSKEKRRRALDEHGGPETGAAPSALELLNHPRDRLLAEIIGELEWELTRKGLR
jgi:hypothetical protein